MSSAVSLSGTTPCLICGYDLGGLGGEGICPECASPAGPSVRRNLFELTGVDHGRRVVRGLQLARDAAWAGVICAVAMIIGAWTDALFLKMAGGGVGIAALAFVSAWWIATRQSRSPMRAEGLRRPARLARWSVAAVPISYFVFMAVVLSGVGSAIMGVSPGLLIGALPFVLLLAMVARLILTSEWIGCLATHLGDDDTPRRVRRRVRLAPILVVLFILLFAGAALARDFSSANGLMSRVGMGASIAVAAAALGTYAWLYIGLIHRGHRLARAAVEAARRRADPSQCDDAA